ncbi:prefoldin subunit 5 [Planococcus citri]|uniref:prefoldin subunit 5 n=1 Tax=Planococcus citri TaxID=170843 RepID=UPI0031F7C9FE
MEKAAPAGPKIVEIDLHKLTLPELSHQKQQFDQELSYLQDSIHTLKVIQSKFQESRKSVEKAQKYSAGQKLLVPLTGSMYVDGEIAETDSFIINVGTGYYIRKNAEGAKDYFQRRLTYLIQQIETLQALGNEKSRIKDAIVGVMQTKIQALAQQAKAKEES